MGRIFSRLNRGAFIYTPFIRLMRDHGELFFGQATKASIFFGQCIYFGQRHLYRYEFSSEIKY
jgi:hypothetical protein